MGKHKKKRSEEHRRKISDNMKSAWASGERVVTAGQVKQARANLKKIHSDPEFGSRISERLKIEHATGIRDATHLSNCKNQAKATEAKRRSDKFRGAVKNNGQLLQRETVKEKRLAAWKKSPKAKEAIAKMRKAMEESPKCQKGVNHHSGRMWHIRSPENVVYSFRNLNQFIRDNPQLFLPEDLEKKAYRGISMLRPNPGKIRVSGSWKGWTWASLTEISLNDGEDVLFRPNDEMRDR